MNKKKNKFSINKLFKNNKFLLLFSFITSCVLWLFFSQGSAEQLTSTIHDIPINIELSQEAKDDGLTIFSGGDTLASVMVSGNRLTVANIVKEDIQVVASQASNTITVPNTYILELSAKQNSSKSDYEILSVDPLTVSIVVDRLRDKEISLTDNITYNYKVDQTYYAGKPYYSVDEIVISGPQSEVNNVAKVAIEGEFSGNLNDTTSMDFAIKLYDETGVEIKSELLTTNVENNIINVTIPVLPKKELPVEVDFINIPKGINIDEFATLSHEQITIAGPQEVISTMSKITLPTIDFNDISPNSNIIELQVELPSSCINISNANTIKVTLNLSSYTSKDITVTDFRIKNLKQGFSANVTTSSLVIHVMGHSTILEDLVADDLDVVIDLDNIGEIVGTTAVTVDVNIIDKSLCWVYDTDDYVAIISLNEI